MLPAVIVLQVLLLIAVAVLLLRKPPASAAPDPRQLQLPDQIARVDAFVRDAISQLRQDIPAEASLSRKESSEAAANLRRELIETVATLGGTLKQGLEDLRADNTASAQALRGEVEQKMQSISRGFSDLKQETTTAHAAFKESLSGKLNDLMASNSGHQDKLRTAVEGRLDQLNATNASKLEEMRLTVDEKLHATLHTRLTESFGQVTDQLNKVHSGLGEMSKLSEGMDDLARIFTNVKSRGGFAEVQLGMLLEQMLAPSQFVRNARVKPNTLEVVEFAVRFPSAAGEVLLPIDAKFPREDWERLENAYTANDPELLAAAGKAFELAIRVEGKRICEKYINPPQTTPHAIMFLPTEGLYAEVMRRDSLQAEIQSKCHVTIAGPYPVSDSDQLPDGLPHARPAGKGRRGLEGAGIGQDRVRQVWCPDGQGRGRCKQNSEDSGRCGRSHAGDQPHAARGGGLRPHRRTRFRRAGTYAAAPRRQCRTTDQELRRHG